MVNFRGFIIAILHRYIICSYHEQNASQFLERKQTISYKLILSMLTLRRKQCATVGTSCSLFLRRPTVEHIPLRLRLQRMTCFQTFRLFLYVLGVHDKNVSRPTSFFHLFINSLFCFNKNYTLGDSRYTTIRCYLFYSFL